MKNKIKLTSFLLIALVTFLIGCGEEKIDPALLPILSADYYEVEVDEYIEFFVENYDSIELFNFYSSDESIVEIDEDNLGYSLKPGKVTITAELKSDERICKSIEITVKNYEIECKISQYILLNGDEFTIDYYNYFSDDEFDIIISNEKIVKKTGEKSYKALSEGDVTITFTLKKDPTISKEVDLTIYSREPILRGNYDEIMVGDKVKIKFLNYIDAEKFIWQVNDENVASLENDLLIAKKSGVVIITVTKIEEPNITKNITIEIRPKQAELLVSSSNLIVGGKTSLFIKNIDELETNDFSKYNVMVDDSTIIEVENDIITALKVGKTTIRVESKENSNIKGEVEINVIELNITTDSNGDLVEGPLVLYSNDPKNCILAGEFFQLYIEGVTDNENYKWVTTDSKIATVNEKGRVIAVNKGITQIAAISKTNKEVKGLIYVTVYGEPNVDYAARLVKIATEEIGYQEGPNNDTKYGKWYNLNYEPWCAMFVSWCANQAGISTDIIPKYCGCTAGMEWFIEKELFQTRESEYLPKAGDVVFFRNSGDKSGSSHTGIVYACDGIKVYTIEGNASDMCKKNSYYLGSTYIVGYGTPNYPEFDGEAATFEPGNPESGENQKTE